MEESNPHVRHGFVLLTKVQDLHPAATGGCQPQPTWFDAAQVVSVARSTWEPDPEIYKDWIRAWSDVVLTPPNQPLLVTETAEEVIDLVAQARDRFMPFERPIEFTTTNEFVKDAENQHVLVPRWALRNIIHALNRLNRQE